MNLRESRYLLGNLFRWLTRILYQHTVDPSEAVTIFGKSFSPTGSHFIIQFLQNDLARLNLAEEPSAIYRFHNSFCPKNTNEALDLNLENELSLFLYPWGVFGSGASETFKDPNVSRFCGPSSEKFITEEENRVRLLFSNLEKFGYKPKKYPNSYIQGVWLVKTNGHRKFVVLQGNHRMACLAVLGSKRISVRSDMFRVRRILESDVQNWPLVRSGKISERDALLVFYKFFEK